MEPFVIILAVLFFSVLDAIAKAQKKRQQERGGQVDAGEGPDATSDGGGRGASQVAVLEAARRRVAARGAGARGGPTSEDVIVPELWEEIKKLARGRGVEPEQDAPPRTVAPPARHATGTTRPAPRPERPAPRPVPATPEGPVHAVHTTHPLMGHPMAERRSPLDKPISEAARHAMSREVTDVRTMLAGGADALRRAVILEEVLGPPVAMRGDPWEPGG